MSAASCCPLSVSTHVLADVTMSLSAVVPATTKFCPARISSSCSGSESSCTSSPRQSHHLCLFSLAFVARQAITLNEPLSMLHPVLSGSGSTTNEKRLKSGPCLTKGSKLRATCSMLNCLHSGSSAQTSSLTSTCLSGSSVCSCWEKLPAYQLCFFSFCSQQVQHREDWNCHSFPIGW